MICDALYASQSKMCSMKYSYLWVVVLLFVGCDSSSNEPLKTSPIMYIPLETGNMWIRGWSLRDTTFITKDTTIQGRIYFKEVKPLYNVTGGRAFGVEEYYLTYLPDGMERIWLDDKGIISVRFLYKYPPMTDSLYEQEGAIGRPPSPTVFTRFVSADSLISIPAGEFSCYVFRTFSVDTEGNTHLIKEEYFAPGVGVVREKRSASSPSSEDLEAYIVGRKPFRIDTLDFSK